MPSTDGIKLPGQEMYPNGPFQFIENYIYLHHVKKYIILPAFVDSVQDNQSISFATTSILARSAPIYSYSYSGPRTVQATFELHRDLMKDLNTNNTTFFDKATSTKLKDMIDNNQDYVDLFIKYIQAAVLPSYEAAYKMVNPPIVSLRLGNDIFIKGVITQGLGLIYKYPILADGRYASVTISLNISEIDPYDAKTVMQIGSFRNVSLERSYSNVTIGDELANQGGSANHPGTVMGGTWVNMVK